MKKWMLCLVALFGTATAQDPRPPVAPEQQPKAPKPKEETKTFTDPVFGITVTYPTRLHFLRDAALTRRIREAAKKLPEFTPEGQAAMQSQSVGIQFYVMTHPAGAAVPFNANLNVTTERVPPDPTIQTNAQYARIAAGMLKRAIPNAKSAYEPVEVKLGKRTWARALTFGTLGGNKLLFLQYMHFDPKTRIAYVITITDLASRDLASVAALEQVAKTVRIKR